MGLFDHTLATAVATLVDVAPIVAILFAFQFLVIRRRPPNLRKIAVGFVYVLAGLTLFLVGLEEALFPIGATMAEQLTAPRFIGLDAGSAGAAWHDYRWVYGFAAAIGFATTVAEPTLIAVSIKAQQISGGSINAVGLRMVVAAGVAAGVALGALRIVTGTPLPIYIMAGYLVVVVQTARVARTIVPLAYDLGGVTTSTVTVPVVTALGLGLASAVPGRNPLVDGFGLIAFASLCPIMFVLGYAQLTSWWQSRRHKEGDHSDEP